MAMVEASASSRTIHTYTSDLERVRKDRDLHPEKYQFKTTPKSKPGTPTSAKKIESNSTKNVQAEIRDTSYPAEIISDKKKRRLSLFERIQHSLQGLITKSRSSSKLKRISTKSTSTATLTSPSDYEKVVAHISKKYNQPEPTLTTPSVSKPITPPTPSWEHHKVSDINEDELSLNNDSVVKPNIPIAPPIITPNKIAPRLPDDNAAESSNSKQARIITPTIPALSSTPPPIQNDEMKTEPEYSKWENSSDTFAAENTMLKNQPPVYEIPQEPAPAITIDANYINTNIKPNTTNDTIIVAPTTQTKPRRNRSLRFLSIMNSLPVIVGVVLVVGVVTYTINHTSIFTFNNSLVTTSEPIGLFQSTTVTTVVPTIMTKENIMRQIYDSFVPDATVSEIHLLNTFTGDGIAGSTIVDLLGFNIPISTRANITSMTFGSYRGNPWIVFHISDTNAVRGGFLQWEIVMSQNLEPLFTTTSQRNNNRSQFIDDIIENIDVRVLKRADGADEIVYGFIRPNVILLTTDSLRFLNLQANFKR